MWKPPNVCICGVVSRSDISVTNYYLWKRYVRSLPQGESIGAASIFRTPGPLSPHRPCVDRVIREPGDVPKGCGEAVWEVSKEIRKYPSSPESYNLVCLSFSLVSVFSLCVNILAHELSVEDDLWRTSLVT